MSPEADPVNKVALTHNLLTDSLLSHKSGTGGGLRDVEEVHEGEERSRIPTSEGHQSGGLKEVPSELPGKTDSSNMPASQVGAYALPAEDEESPPDDDNYSSVKQDTRNSAAALTGAAASEAPPAIPSSSSKQNQDIAS